MIKSAVFGLVFLCFMTSAHAVPDIGGIADSSDNMVEKLNVTETIQALLKSDITLSRAAQNIGIVQKHSTLILRGSVKSEEEKTRVGKIAEDAAEGLRIINDTRVITHE